jgi:hypothetical protein
MSNIQSRNIALAGGLIFLIAGGVSFPFFLSRSRDSGKVRRFSLRSITAISHF